MPLICGAENYWSEDERKACMIESMEISKELEKQGKWIAASPLHSMTTATSVRVRDDKRQITDGPFAETTEQLGGYCVINVENLDEASPSLPDCHLRRKGPLRYAPCLIFPKSHK